MKNTLKKEYLTDNAKDSRNSDSTTYSLDAETQQIEFEDIFNKLDMTKATLENSRHHQIKQVYITSQMIRKVVDWLFSNFWRLDFENQCIFMCLELMKRYLKSNVIQKNKLQALALTCMFVTSKFMQVKRLKMEDILNLCQNNYSKEDIVEMEYDLLRTIDFCVESVTLDKYLECFKEQKLLSKDQENKIMFWLQISLLQELLTDKIQKRILLEVFDFVTSDSTTQGMRKLIDFSKTTQHKYLIRRFNSDFDVEDYLQQIIFH